MTIASLLLALVTAANGPGADGNADPILLDFHSERCGPCKQMRPVVNQFIRNGYPVKTVDIDRAADLAERYDVRAVPTFIVTDGAGRELGRTSGYQPLNELERFYRTAAAKARPPQNSNAHTGGHDDDGANSPRGEAQGERADDELPLKRASRRVEPADRPEEEADARAEPMPVNPKPWESVVRIRVLAKNSVGFGSGTVIYSTPSESLILTCAHIFKLEGRAKPVPPSQFPREIKIDLFDGKLRGRKPAQVHYHGETVDGEAVDYDFVHDVGLIRIRPGKRLPASRVAPAYWEPATRMRMLTVGCSEGQDASAWYTVIKNPRMSGSLIGSPAYEAIECDVAPKQGRSGGGLFTDNGYIAGVCNFAEPRGDHGLYATPRSIYRLLDRNQLAALYAPVPRDGGTLMADATGPNRGPVARMQSPGAEDGERTEKLASSGQLMIPPPELLGVPDLAAQTEQRQPGNVASTRSTRRPPWTLSPGESARTELQTDLNLDPAADHDHFGASGKPRQSSDAVADVEEMGSKPDGQTAAGSGSKPRWRAVRPGTVAQGVENRVSE